MDSQASIVLGIYEKKHSRLLDRITKLDMREGLEKEKVRMQVGRASES
jgi:hypothetical protein